MQRQRGELVPIGEVVSGLDDVLVPAIREASPQARHHFTRADQVNQLVGASEADPDLGFHGANDGACVRCRAPIPATGKEYKFASTAPTRWLHDRRSGGNKLPFWQSWPRLCCWPGFRTEAVQDSIARVADPGLTRLTDFMDKLGMATAKASGRSGERTRLRNQMDRLFNATRFS